MSSQLLHFEHVVLPTLHHRSKDINDARVLLEVGLSYLGKMEDEWIIKMVIICGHVICNDGVQTYNQYQLFSKSMAFPMTLPFCHLASRWTEDSHNQPKPVISPCLNYPIYVVHFAFLLLVGLYPFERLPSRLLVCQLLMRQLNIGQFWSFPQPWKQPHWNLPLQMTSLIWISSPQP